MKLKKKLAFEYVTEELEKRQGNASVASYLAGFEKARELALRELGRSYRPSFTIAELGEEEIE